MKASGDCAPDYRRILPFFAVLASLMITSLLPGQSHARPSTADTTIEASNNVHSTSVRPGQSDSLHCSYPRTRESSIAVPIPTGKELCELERRIVDAGLVNVKEIDDTILVDLKYASPDNFMGANVYGDLKECYLQREAALMLKVANDILKRRQPNLNLLVVDGCRPRSVQYRMWEIVKDTPMQKYVANPAVGSMHNYGAAVDVTIVDRNGRRLDMGAPMDHFGILSHPREETRLFREGRLSQQQVAARKFLREVMTKAGFHYLGIEWWHFNACDRKTAARKYSIID